MLKSMRRIFEIYRRYRARLLISQILVLASATATIGVASRNATLVNDGIEAGDPEVVIQVGLQMLVLAAVAGLCMAGAASIAVFFSQGSGLAIRSLLYQKIQTYQFENFDRFRISNLMVRLNSDVINVQNAMLWTTMLGLYAPFMVLVTLALTIINTPEMTWVLIVLIAVVLILMAFLVPVVFSAYEARQKRLDELNNTMQENLTGVRVVKAFTREQYEIERFAGRADDLRKPAYIAAFRVGFLSPMLTGIAQLAIALSLAVGGTAILTGAGMNIGELIAFQQYLTLIIAPLAMMAIVIPFLLRGDASAERILEAYDAEATITDREDVKALEPHDVQGRIRFENVTFAFRRADGDLDPPVLKNIDLTIEPGEQIGILGATGSGKSALINLLPRFYDVTDGRITIDGIDVRDVPLDNLRSIVAIALQEALLFQGDVRFNLKFAQPDAEDYVMADAAKAADAHGFIVNLPEQWEAPVTRRGYNFSGGQRQRL